MCVTWLLDCWLPWVQTQSPAILIFGVRSEECIACYFPASRSFIRKFAQSAELRKLMTSYDNDVNLCKLRHEVYIGHEVCTVQQFVTVRLPLCRLRAAGAVGLPNGAKFWPSKRVEGCRFGSICSGGTFRSSRPRTPSEALSGVLGTTFGWLRDSCFILSGLDGDGMGYDGMEWDGSYCFFRNRFLNSVWELMSNTLV